MLVGRKIVVVLPAYNAAKTLEQTVAEIPPGIVDEVLLVDDKSHDETLAVARRLGLRSIAHPENLGYGGNQKTCYREALALGADVVIMLHPDYQYSPKLVPAMAGMIVSGEFDVVLGSRILGIGALAGGMPLWKYVSNRSLTAFQNLMVGHKLSEYHTGYRAFSRRLLESLPLEENQDGFVFDAQMLVQAVHFGYRIAEVTCPTVYSADSSSIRFWPSVRYGFGVLHAALQLRLVRLGFAEPAFLSKGGRRLPSS